MTALHDLDSLLGDLEETCARQPSLSHMQPARVQNGHAKMSVNKGPGVSHVNELDSLLDDLSKNRCVSYSCNLPTTYYRVVQNITHCINVSVNVPIPPWLGQEWENLIPHF